MATLWSLSFNQYRDADGRAYGGATVSFFNGGTTTPRVVYQDNALTTPYGSVVTADANGMFPAIYLPAGLYNFVIQSAGGVQIAAGGPIDPAPATISGGGGGGSVDPTTIFQTGDVMWQPTSGMRTGWVRDNGRTIGNAASGATERANNDTEALFAFYWNTYSDTLCPVSGGRGSTAAADFAFNKTIQTLDMRGRGPFGLDDMGNTAANRLIGAPFMAGNAITAGSLGGEATHTLTTSEMPAHSHTATVSDPGHSHAYTRPALYIDDRGLAPPNFASVGTAAANTNSSVTGISVSIASAGSNAAHNTMPLFALGAFYRKL